MAAPLPAVPVVRDAFSEQPFLVFWEITRACALACRHCRAEAQPRRHPDELDEGEALRLVDQLAELAPPMLILTGGDPLMRRDVLAIARRAADAGMRVGLSPSGTQRLVNFDFHAIRGAGVERLSLSLDGATEESARTLLDATLPSVLETLAGN